MPGLRDLIQHKMRAQKLRNADGSRSPVFAAEPANEPTPEMYDQHWPEKLENGDKKAPRMALQFYLSQDCNDQGMPFSLTLVDTDHRSAIYLHSEYGQEEIISKAKRWIIYMALTGIFAGILICHVLKLWLTMAP